MSDRIGALLPRLTLLLIVLINALFIAGYVWSRGGQTTHARLEVHGDTYSASIDGRAAMSATMPAAPGSGGLSLGFGDQVGVPSEPGPHAVDRVRVTDLASGAVLLDENFDGGGASSFESGDDVRQGGGVLHIGQASSLTLADVDWTDIAVDVTYRNIGLTSIRVHTQPDGGAAVWSFAGYTGNDQQMTYFSPSRASETFRGPAIELDRWQTVRGMVAMVTRPYPLAAALLLVGAVIATVAAVGFRRVGELEWADWRRDTWSFDEGEWYAAGAVALLVFGVTLVLLYHVSEHISNWPDATAYLFQAKIFASGHIAAPAPPVPESFDFFYPPLTVVTDGKWSGIFPFGHPMMLAFGERVGAVWLVPPLVAAACVGLLFAVGRRIYGVSTGILGIALLASSPFFLIYASNYMSHNTAMFYLLASLLCIVSYERRPVLMGILAGLSFGLFFNTRPLTAVALAGPWAALLLTHLRVSEHRVIGVRHLGAFAAGGLLMLGAYLLYNHGTTGGWWVSNYQSRDAGQLGFDGAHSVAAGMQNERINLALLLLVQNGWPQYIGGLFVALPFLLGTRNPWDWFCLACAVSIMAATVLFSEPGPRLWYEALPFLLLLTARGAERAAQALAGTARALTNAPALAADRVRVVSAVAVYACVAALIASSVYGWLLGRHAGWHVDVIPASAADLRGFNGIDGRMVALMERSNLRHALVLVNECPHWQCYGSVFTLNEPGLDGNVIFAKDLPAANARLLAAYPDRRVYRADYDAAYLIPYGVDPARRMDPRVANTQAPLASEILSTMPAAVQ